MFHLENDNFSSNAYTGVGFVGKHNIDAVIVRVNDGELDVFTLSLNRSFAQNDLLNVTNKAYTNRHLLAEFSRPVFTNSSNLDSCLTWIFLASPMRQHDGYYNFGRENAHEMQVCHITRSCDASKLVQSEKTLTPTQRSLLAQSSVGRANVIPAQRVRKAAGYVPTDNIYGYDYSSSSSSNRGRLVVNPNYNYLNDQLLQRFAQNYVQAEQEYERNALQKDYTIPSQTASLNNNQQNALNYQQIQQRYGIKPDDQQPYLNNGHGYVAPESLKMYDPRNSQISSVPGGNIFGQNDMRNRYTSSPTPYQSVVDLKTTRLRDPTSSGFYSDSMYTLSNNMAMYSPYR
ncbi:hypothetical protein KIN20_032207 [Parelaphostrongylus tenuis]|uniref:DOMON domain-containing protein n=1 Tax=Parelaphostrongylus tenuis TaxID=148309 RepID=A0AAD5WIC0_PARTN|nr:hypothetical protein KIN20_032207 [Parelaphostrongylus tenuis]